MIYELVGKFNNIDSIIFPYEILWNQYYYLNIFYAMGLLLTCIISIRSIFNYHSNKFFNFCNSRLIDTFILTILYIVFFTMFFNQSDEVFVNLEHTYNLKNFNQFSMSPFEAVDGTIEYIFYLLHYPFANSLQSLVWGNYFIALFFSLIIVYIIFYQVKNLSPLPRLLFGISLSVSAAIIAPLANGFGSSLTVMFFLLSIIAAINKSRKLTLLFIAIIPLTRPDGIIWAYISSAAWAFSEFKKLGNCKKLLGEIFVFFLIPTISLLSILVSAYVYYGHIIPNPISFKGGVLIGTIQYIWENSKIALFKIILGFNDGGLKQYLLIFSYITFLFSLLFGFKNLVDKSHRFYILSIFILCFPFVIFYFISSNVVGFSGNIDNRYIAPFICMIFLFFGFTLDAIKIESPRGLIIVPMALICFAIFGLLDRTVMLSSFPNQPGNWSNRHWAVFAGNLSQKIVEGTNLQIGTTEMNTFGFMIKDRHIIDYWGYTNPKIAKSKTCNGMRIKNNSNLFLIDKPDLFWPYWFTVFSNENNFNTVEEAFGERYHTSPSALMLGNMEDVFASYDFLILNGGDWPVAFLVRHDRTKSVLNKLKKMGYGVVGKRPYDLKRLRDSVNSVPSISYPC
ncbi:hypothetical protein [Polynucleobacter sp. Tro8-14-1]|uniref:hypothetical protein n=1 Tax=Polynucleobacter sp. Tro8-14-1 TaxID=1758383 RepID=UPI001C0CB466|nr:hypothetical protein [Polynucleobacter sp. Tro8-14-1]MBU3563630.1 hypothetical protein [Polynucleobacter sp. Tro8-14-1]